MSSQSKAVVVVGGGGVVGVGGVVVGGVLVLVGCGTVPFHSAGRGGRGS